MATVLVVDDEPPILDLLAELIEDAGHTAITAMNGRDGLAMAHAHHPDLIISDVRMPKMDGEAMLEALRADPNLAQILVILVSANFRTNELQVGPLTARIAKPLDLTLIESFLSQLP